MEKNRREFKLAIVKKHALGTSSYALEKEYGITSATIRYWARVYRIHGSDSFITKVYSAEERLEIILRMKKNNWSLNHASALYNLVSPQTLYRWINYYEAEGFHGLEPRKIGGKVKKKSKSPISNKAISEMTEQELRRELEYRRAEEAVLKKLQEWAVKKAAQQKKKQE